MAKKTNIQLATPDICTGCAACANVCPRGCIAMVEDREGFLQPKIDSKVCIGCHKCEKTCPIINQNRDINTCSVIESYAFRVTDEEILFNSSSGGAFFAIASEVIKNHGAVVGVVYNDQLEVVHSVARDMQGVKKMMGSKYVQSKISDIYYEIKTLLESDVQVLFTGTPCQVDGLMHYLHHDYSNLLTVDLVCDGVPSPLIFHDYIQFAQKSLGAQVQTIKMRNKKYVGWGCPDNNVIVTNKEHFVMRDPRIAPWNLLYFKTLFVRPSCHSCKYCNVNRVGDFTIADYWDFDHKHDEVYSKKGTSLVFVNTEKAKCFFDTLKKANFAFEISWRDMLQERLVSAKAASPNRGFFWNDYHERGFEYCYMKYFSDAAVSYPRHSVKWKIKRFIKDFITPGIWKFDEDTQSSISMKFVSGITRFIRKGYKL